MTTTAHRLTVSQVCSNLPGARGAKRLHPATVVRWITSGCPTRDGRRVRLRATRCGSRWLVDPDDLETFFAALAADPAEADPLRSPTERIHAAEAAGKELEAIGA